MTVDLSAGPLPAPEQSDKRLGQARPVIKEDRQAGKQCQGDTKTKGNQKQCVVHRQSLHGIRTEIPGFGLTGEAGARPIGLTYVQVLIELHTEGMPRAQTKIDTEKLTDNLKSLQAAAAAGDDDKKISLKRGGSGDLIIESSAGDFATRVSLDAGGSGKLNVQVPFKAFQQLARAAGEKLALHAEKDQLVLQSGNRLLRLDATSGNSFVFAPECPDPEPLATISGPVLIGSLPKAVLCASEDPIRPVLHSVALFDQDGGLRLVATDSYRLAEIPLGVSPDQSLEKPLLMPYESAKALSADLKRRKPEQVEVLLSKRHATTGLLFRYDSVEWTMQCVDGRYPDYTSLYPEEGKSLQLDRKELSEVLDGVEAIGAKRRRNGNSNSALRLDLSDRVSASYSQPGVGTLEEAMPGSTWAGEETAAGFNPAFLRDLLRVIDDGQEKLCGSTEGAMKPALFRDDAGARYLLMPIRLTDI